jgi:hypothetical protein
VKRLLSTVAFMLIIVGATASTAFAWSYSYGAAYYNPQGSTASPWDNCSTYSFWIDYNIFKKSVTRLGRSAVILTDGSWVGSAQDSNQWTVAYTNTNYRTRIKKGYNQNTSTVGYTGSGEVDGGYSCRPV